MNAALYEKPKKINLINFPLREIKDDELLIKVGACGICGTDFHIFNGEAPAASSVIIGHEYTGEIMKTGKKVKDFKEGDRVAVNPNIHCGYCEFCKKGKINLCENLKALGVTINGGLAEFSIIPQSQAYILPENIPFEVAAFAEPLSCCIHGINLTEIKINDSVAIIGAGTIGLLMLQLVKINGAGRVLVIEPNEEKQKLALTLKADEVLNTIDEKNIKKYLSDVVIECAGNKTAAETAVKLSKRGGKIIIFGLAASDSIININLQEIFHKEITLKTSLLNPFTFQTAVDLLAEGKIKVDVFNTNKISLNNADLQNLFSNRANSSVIKNMVIPN